MLCVKKNTKLFVRGELIPREDYTEVVIPPCQVLTSGYVVKGKKGIEVTYTNGDVCYYNRDEANVLIGLEDKLC